MTRRASLIDSLGINVDITDRKRTEEALRKQMTLHESEYGSASWQTRCHNRLGGELGWSSGLLQPTHV